MTSFRLIPFILLSALFASCGNMKVQNFNSRKYLNLHAKNSSKEVHLQSFSKDSVLEIKSEEVIPELNPNTDTLFLKNGKMIIGDVFGIKKKSDDKPINQPYGDKDRIYIKNIRNADDPSVFYKPTRKGGWVKGEDIEKVSYDNVIQVGRKDYYFDEKSGGEEAMRAEHQGSQLFFRWMLISFLISFVPVGIWLVGSFIMILGLLLWLLTLGGLFDIDVYMKIYAYFSYTMFSILGSIILFTLILNIIGVVKHHKFRSRASKIVKVGNRKKAAASLG